jgi:hypothetical protein
VFAFLCKWGSDLYSSCLIEARPISSLSTIAYHEYYDVKYRSPLYASESIEADLVNDTMLVVKAVNGVYVKFLEACQEETKQNEAWASVRSSSAEIVTSEE